MADSSHPSHESSDSTAPRDGYAHILATTDFSSRSMPGVFEAARLARAFGSRVTLLFVVEDQLPPLLGTLTLEEREEILENHRKRAVTELGEHARKHLAGLEVKTVARAGVPAEQIVDGAREAGADLIVIASRGYGPLRQLLLGSTAERVLHHAPCPVLIVPSGKT